LIPSQTIVQAVRDRYRVTEVSPLWRSPALGAELPADRPDALALLSVDAAAVIA